MKLILFTAALVTAPVLAQSQSGTSITTRPTTAKSAAKPLQPPTPTVKDALQPVGTSITTRSAVSQPRPARDNIGMAQAPRYAPAPMATSDYPWCSRTVQDQCRQRSDRR